MGTVTASRRQLERDLENFIDQYSFAQIIHALVEVCHKRTPVDPLLVDYWREVCAILSAAERRAEESRL